MEVFCCSWFCKMGMWLIKIKCRWCPAVGCISVGGILLWGTINAGGVLLWGSQHPQWIEHDPTVGVSDTDRGASLIAYIWLNVTAFSRFQLWLEYFRVRVFSQIVYHWKDRKLTSPEICIKIWKSKYLEHRKLWQCGKGHSLLEWWIKTKYSN